MVITRSQAQRLQPTEQGFFQYGKSYSGIMQRQPWHIRMKRSKSVHSPGVYSSEQCALSGKFNFDNEMLLDDRALRPKNSRSGKRKDQHRWACLKVIFSMWR